MRRLISRLRSVVRGVWRRAELEADVNEEFRFHLERRAEDLVRSGLSPAEARRRAQLEFGSTECYREEGMEARGLRYFDELRRDVRYLVRTLLFRDRSFSLTVLLTLGVCLGANVAIYSVVQTVLLSPLPFEKPDRLVRMSNSYPGAGSERVGASAPDFFVRRERVESLQEVALYRLSNRAVGNPGNTEHVSSLQVTPSFFPMLGVRTVLGRTFLEEEMDPGGERTVVLTHDYWQTRFGGSPNVLDQALRIGGRDATIVGVLPESFQFPEEPGIRFVTPLSFSLEQRTLGEEWHSNYYEMLGRLAPGATIDQVRAEIAALNASLIHEWPVPNGAQLLTDAGFHTIVSDAHEDLVRNVKAVLFLLWGGVGFVLFIGCVNIANLMLTRSLARARELATRLALGARRVRLARQIVTEAAMLGLLGAALGVGLGVLALNLLGFMGIEDLPRAAGVEVNPPVLLYTMAIGLGASALFGAIPIVHLYRGELSSVFRSEGREATVSRRAAVLRSGLVAGQVGVAFLLLVGAGLMFRSFRAALEVDPGFEPQGVLTAYMSLPSVRYPGVEERRRFMDELLAEVRMLPGVSAAAVTGQLPFGPGSSNTNMIMPESYEPPAGESFLAPRLTLAGPGYFDAMGIELVEGRPFDQGDGAEQRKAIIIDEWLARRFWPDRSPLGQRMKRGVSDDAAEEENLYTVIGVVETIKHDDLTAPETEHSGAWYVTYRQLPPRSLALVVRTATEPSSLTGTIRAVLAELDPELPLFDVQTLDDRVTASLGTRRTPAVLLLIFAGIALFLAVVGIYGVLAYSVAQRTREIGIRMALGGQPMRILGLVLKQGLTLTGLGLAVGGVAAFFLVRLIQSLLFGVQPMDPLVMATTALLLGLAAALACLIPARRATRVDPVAALAQ